VSRLEGVLSLSTVAILDGSSSNLNRPLPPNAVVGKRSSIIIVFLQPASLYQRLAKIIFLIPACFDLSAMPIIR